MAAASSSPPRASSLFVMMLAIFALLHCLAPANAAENKPLEVDCLGRAFSPGMLYDARTDSLVQGYRLWDLDKIKSNTETRPLKGCTTQLYTSLSMAEKVSHLDIKASLEVSFLAGLVKLSGSAEYLNDVKSSTLDEKMSICSKVRTKHEELLVSECGPIQHAAAIDSNIATHVVTSVTYGGDAAFVFEHNRKDESADFNLKGRLDAMVKAASLEVKGHAEAAVREAEKQYSDSVSCTYYGDFVLNSIPTSLEESVSALHDISKQVADGRKPMKATLIPIKLVDSRASQLVREISKQTIEDVAAYHQTLGDCINMADSMAKGATCRKLTALSSELKNFAETVKQHQREFSGLLCEKLPKVRETGEGEEELIQDLIRMRDRTPFREDVMEKWIEDRQSEIAVLETRFEDLVDSCKVQLKLHKPDLLGALGNRRQKGAKMVLYFPTALRSKMIPLMQKAVQAGRNSANQDFRPNDEVHVDANWVESSPEIASHFDRIATFVEAQALGDSDTTTAPLNVYLSQISAPVNDAHDMDIVVKLRVAGSSVDRSFVVPSAPGKPVASGSGKSIRIKWTKPHTGDHEVKGYRVMYWKKAAGMDSKNVITIDSPDIVEHTFVQGSIEPSAIYQAYVVGTTDAGATPRSDISEFGAVAGGRGRGKYLKDIRVEHFLAAQEDPDFLPFKKGRHGLSSSEEAIGNINRGFEGKFVFLRSIWTDSPSEAADRVELARYNTVPNWVNQRTPAVRDLAAGAGGDYRFLDVWHSADKNKITEVALWESDFGGEVPDGWDGMSQDLNAGRGGRYLHIVWKTEYTDFVVVADVFFVGWHQETVFNVLGFRTMEEAIKGYDEIDSQWAKVLMRTRPTEQVFKSHSSDLDWLYDEIAKNITNKISKLPEGSWIRSCKNFESWYERSVGKYRIRALCGNGAGGYLVSTLDFEQGQSASNIFGVLTLS